MNPVEKNYLKELLEYIGLDLRMDDKESEYSIICDAEGIAYARVRDGGYHINDSVPLEKEYQIQDAIQRAYGFRVQFERSESLDSLGVNGYRKIGGFGDAVLAAKLMQDNRMEYVVWNYDANRKGLNQGAYCSQLETAKMKLSKFKGFLKSLIKRFQMKIFDEKYYDIPEDKRSYTLVAEDLEKSGIFDNNDSDIVHNSTRKVLTNDELSEIQAKKEKKKNDYNLN